MLIAFTDEKLVLVKAPVWMALDMRSNIASNL